jgi:hypothetical protein
MSVLFNNAQAYESNPWSGPTIAIGSFTLAVRVYTADITTSGQTCIDMDGSGGGGQLIILDTGTSPPCWNGFLINDAHSSFPGVSGPSNVTINTWYHLCLTYDGTTVTLYVNGTSVGTNTPGAITRTGNWAYFGAPVNWIGSVQDAVGYSVALSAAEVKQLYLARRPRARNGLRVHWPLLTAPGLQDFSGVGPAASVNGTAASVGLNSAPVPWGVFDVPGPVIRPLSSGVGALTGSQLETAGVTASALLLAADASQAASTAAAITTAQQLSSAVMAASALQTIAANQVQTAIEVAVAQVLGSGVQSANEAAAAKTLAANVQTAFALASGGGGGGSAATRSPANLARRPLVFTGRRGSRAR